MSSAKTLVISFVGMKSQEVGVKSKLNIVLEHDNQMLDEVMVVAYGTAKKVLLRDRLQQLKVRKSHLVKPLMLQML